MRRLVDVRRLIQVSTFLTALVSFSAFETRPIHASPAITMDVASGEVLFQEEATRPWFPASTTKLMTVFVALSAVRDHQIEMNTPLVVSARAHKMPPSKMGFPVGTQVTLDNALKMLMVRSANDVAITVAEGVAGSVEAFAEDMNQTAAQLGMRESHFVNPNGLPDPNHVSSVRDMAILARALYIQFPQEAGLFNLGELSMGSERIPNHNNLLGRYPGVDGMKTGFTCAAGFNVVASAYRDGRRLAVVVFGAPSVKMRSEKVAALLDRGFAGVDHPIGSIVALPSSSNGGAPDMRDQVCRGRGRLIAEFSAEVAQLDAPLLTPMTPPGPLGLSALNPEKAFLFNAQTVANIGAPMAPRINSMPTPVFEPVPVRIGADFGYTGAVAQARAPHTPIGTETPPTTAEAYAATQPERAAASVLGVDPSALPLRGRSKLARVKRSRAIKAALEAPATKVRAGKEQDDLGATDSVKKNAVEKPATEKLAHAAKAAPKKMAIGDGDNAKSRKGASRYASASAKKKGASAESTAKPKADTE